MEILYFVDRTMTNGLQWFSRKLEKVIRVRVELQPFLLIFPSIFCQQILGTFLGLHTGKSDWGIPLYLLALILLVLSAMIGAFLGLILEVLHAKIDPERYFAEKDFSCGHIAWGHTILSFIAISLALFDRTSSFVWHYWGLGFFAFIPNAYRAFIFRRKYDRTDKKQTVSEALRKLIERCRSWLPKPAPLPS